MSVVLSNFSFDDLNQYSFYDSKKDKLRKPKRNEDEEYNSNSKKRKKDYSKNRENKRNPYE